MNIKELLKKSFFCDILPPLDLEMIAPFFIFRNYQQGETIFQEGDPGQELFLVISGTVEESIQCPDGSIRSVGTHGPKDLFGEMSIVEKEPRSATAEAITDADVLILTSAHFYHLIQEHPQWGTKILMALNSLLVKRLSQASSFLDEMLRWGESAHLRVVTDDLTGLYNQRFLEKALKTRFSGPPLPTAVFMLDLDKFREVNQRFGTEAGDAVISHVGVCLSQTLRPNDIPARLSGDEFVILLLDTHKDEALSVAENIRKSIEELFLEFRLQKSTKPSRWHASVSIGIATFPSLPWSQEKMLKAADKALYQAKIDGKNRIRFAQTS